MKYYEIAAVWWADKLRLLNLPEYFNLNKEKESNIIQNAQYLLTEKNIEDFEKKLAKLIYYYVEKDDHLTIGVSKSPDSLLTQVAKETNVFNCNFPQYSSMYISKNNVYVYDENNYLQPKTIFFNRK